MTATLDMLCAYMVTTLRFSLPRRPDPGHADVAAHGMMHGAIDWPPRRSGPEHDCANPQTGRPWVLMVPGYGASVGRGFFPTVGRTLAASGIACVRMNYGGSGIAADLRTFTDADSARTHTYLDELADLHTIWTRANSLPSPDGCCLDPDRAGVFGHSRGAAMALVHAAETSERQPTHPCRAAVSWAGMSAILRFAPERLDAWRRDGELDVRHQTAGREILLDISVLRAAERARGRLDPLLAVARLPCPLLVAQGRDDSSTTVEDAEALAHAAGASTKLAIVPGDHVFDAREDRTNTFDLQEPMVREPWPHGFTQAVQQTTEFLKTHLDRALEH